MYFYKEIFSNKVKHISKMMQFYFLIIRLYNLNSFVFEGLSFNLFHLTICHKNTRKRQKNLVVMNVFIR